MFRFIIIKIQDKYIICTLIIESEREKEWDVDEDKVIQSFIHARLVRMIFFIVQSSFYLLIIIYKLNRQNLHYVSNI